MALSRASTSAGIGCARFTHRARECRHGVLGLHRAGGGSTLTAVTFRPTSIQGVTAQSAGQAARAVGGQSGTIDYRLARRHLVNEYKRKRLSQKDICDAHPELVRAAEGIGTITEHPCPICEDHVLVHVTYVFGDRLPAHGRVVEKLADLRKLGKAHDDLGCYIVEVCLGCRWNHLAKYFRFGKAHRRPPAAAPARV
jgi:hypothetical protein